MRHNYIGEIETQREGVLTTLSCEMINDTDMALILCDEQGRTHFERNFKLQRGKNKLNLQLKE